MKGKQRRKRTVVRRAGAPPGRRLPLNAVYGKGRDIVVRQIENETLLVPIHRKAPGKDAIYTLNAMGTIIWRMVDGTRSVGQVRARILRDYVVAPRRLDADLAVFFEDLLKIGALRKRGARR